MQQAAAGGNSGGSKSGNPGLAGSAASTLNATENDLFQLDLESDAFGGNGGDSQSTTGTTGGTATASATAHSNSPISVSAFANSSSLTFLEIHADGGGSNITAGIGTAGNGGNASATVSAFETGTSVGDTVDAGATAYAGNGGDADAVGVTGNGGAGAIGTAGGSASSSSPDTVDLTVSSFGGNGGVATGSGFLGGAGGIATLNSVAATSTAGGAITIAATATGGTGGDGDGAGGGSGGSVSLFNVVSGSTSGTLTLTQSAIGGNAGSSHGGSSAGTGGNAFSTLTLSQPGCSNLTATVSAAAGSGGDLEDANAPAGGIATSSINLTGNQIVSATASSLSIFSIGIGGIAYTRGGDITAGPLIGFTAGAGGTATATATATGTGTIATESRVAAEADSLAQNGGDVASSVYGNGGNGGAAASTSTATGAGPDSVTATSNATGGNGGQGQGGIFISGAGGNAIASATANAPLGIPVASATAQGGAPGVILNSATPGASGSASSTAKATSSGPFAFVQSTATAPGDKAAKAFSIDSIASDPTAFFNSLPLSTNAAAETVGNLPAADAAAFWSFDSNVIAAFGNVSANVNVLGLANLVYSASGTGASHVYSTVQELNENSAQLNSNHLIVGLLYPNITGSGLLPGDTLRFRVLRQGNTLIDQTFASSAAAASFMQNSALDLGVQNANLAGANLDLQFLFDLTSTHPGAGIGELFLVGSNASAPGGTWVHPTGGIWATPGDWSANTMPDGPGTQATFDSAISSPQIISLNANTTVGSMTFSNLNSYTISPGAGNFSLFLDNVGTSAGITVFSGNHTISAPITLTSPGLNANFAVPSTLSLTGAISGSGPLVINGAGTLKLGPSIGAVNLTGLAVTGSAVLDLNNNHIFVNYAGSPDPISSIAAWIKSGYTSGAWTGAGIDSSAAASNPSYGIGYADAADPGNPAGLAPGQIEIAYTLLGDANLDGKVNGTDFNLMATNFNQAVTNGWDKGDFNYDGKVNGSDFVLLADNFNQFASQSAVSAADLAALDSFAAANGISLAKVPEPASAGTLVMAGLGILRRRRRSWIGHDVHNRAR